MGDVVDFLEMRKAVLSKEKTFNELLKNAVEIGETSLGSVKMGIFEPEADVKTLFVSMITALLLREKQIDDELFRCALYAGDVFEKLVFSVPESYFVCDYYIKGWEEGRPLFFRKGADLCYVICVLFDQFAQRRSMRRDDYVRLGMQLYYLYYQQTSESIGWCMSNNFKGIVDVAKRSFENFARGDT